MKNIVFKHYTDYHNLGCDGCVFCKGGHCDAPENTPNCFGGIFVEDKNDTH